MESEKNGAIVFITELGIGSLAREGWVSIAYVTSSILLSLMPHTKISWR